MVGRKSHFPKQRSTTESLEWIDQMTMLKMDFAWTFFFPIWAGSTGWVVRYLGAPLKYPEWSKQAWLWTYLGSPFNVGNLVFNRELLAWPLQTCLYKNIDTRQIINKCYETFEDWKQRLEGAKHSQGTCCLRSRNFHDMLTYQFFDQSSCENTYLTGLQTAFRLAVQVGCIIASRALPSVGGNLPRHSKQGCYLS